jgi:hypothetical protein
MTDDTSFFVVLLAESIVRIIVPFVYRRGNVIFSG